MKAHDSEPRYADLVSSAQPEPLDWDDFRIFVEVTRQGSFNKAAVRLNMTQPTVSRRLARLEKAVGVRLFDRDRRGPRLTYEGQRVYDEAMAAQASLQRATSQPPALWSGESGECKLLMSEALATFWMSRFVTGFCIQHPHVDLMLYGTNKPTLDKRELSDLHVHYYDTADDGRGSVRLATLHYMPFASRSYVERYGRPREAASLEHHRLIDQAADFSGVSNWAQWLIKDRARACFFTNLSGSLAEAVRSGAGIALMPTYAAALDPEFVPLDIGMSYPAPVSMSPRSDATGRSAVSAVYNYLRDVVFQPEEMPWFAADFVSPEADWPERLRALLDSAEGREDSPGAAAG